MWPLEYRVGLLSALALQNTALVLLMKHVTTEHAFPSTLGVVMVELIKVGLCIGMELPRHHYSLHSIACNVMHDPCIIAYALPAILYAVQNNLCLIAVSRMGPVEYQVLYQSKIMTTALCAWLMLGRTIRTCQWVSLVILTVGVCSVAVEPRDLGRTGRWGEDHWVGCAAIGLASLSSGFCGAFLERLSKSGGQQRRSVALQSMGLAAYSLPMAVLLHLFMARGGGAGVGSLLSPKVLLLFLMQSGSGLLVGAVIKHADNVLKSFATSVSLVLSAAITAPSNRIVLGTSWVSLAVVLFAFGESRPAKWGAKKIKSSNI